jgi:hypothetical protein
MYEATLWKDHVTEYEDRYIETKNDDGTINHIPVEGEIIQQGTPQNATNFNHIEEGVTNAGELASILAITTMQQARSIENMIGEVITTTLTNSQTYPFNNSVKTVALAKERNHNDYTVEVEVLEVTGGFAGDIVISEKLVNGFKIATTGSATSVKVKIYVKGGFY